MHSHHARRARGRFLARALPFCAVICIASAAIVRGAQDAPPAEPKAVRPGTLSVKVPGATVSIDLAPVPGAAVTVLDPQAEGGERRIEVAPFLIGVHELTWDAYDAFVFAQDRAQGAQDPPDAFSRPSKPYIGVDRGYGHAGYPAISISFKGAQEFCRWLSAKTGRRFRLPTEPEWELACRAGGAGRWSHGDDEAALAQHAWYRDNSERSTHPVGAKRPNALGLFDLHGNAAEWCLGADGKGVLRGGSFRDKADKLEISARRADDPAFNATDPQIPKSVWWLADGGFIGFRVVCEPSEQSR